MATDPIVEMMVEEAQMTAARRRLGEFELIEEIGRGGMGIVFRAERSSDGRVVAVKVLPAAVALDADAVERFAREAEAAARLSHPGILPILAFGEDQGVHYFATDLIEGPSLDAVLGELRSRDPHLLSRSIADETTLGVACPGARNVGARADAPYARSCAAIAADLASALAAAHGHRLIHRDVKPGNVLINPAGQALLVDFGLSRDETAAGLTRSGDAVGTPAYMAPEQANGRRDIDARVDVWGLGATLYELLTLRPPFGGSHPGKIMRSILDDDVVPVRVHNPNVPVGLANIVQMCLRKDRAERYPDAASLERDLRAFLSGGKIAARPLGALRRLRDRGRAYVRPVALAVSLASVLVAALLGGSAWWRQSALRQGQAQLAEAARAVLALDEAAAEAAYAAAQRLLSPEHIARARVEHLEAVPVPEPGEARAAAAFLGLLDAVPVQRQGPRTQVLRARIEGVGLLRLFGLERQRQLPILRRLRGEATTDLALPSDGVLPVGAYRLQAKTAGGVEVRASFRVERESKLRLVVPDVPATVTGPVLLGVGPAGPVALAMAPAPFVVSPGADPRRALQVEAARSGTHPLSPRFVALAVEAGVLPPSPAGGAGQGVWFARSLAMPDAPWAAERSAVEARLALAAARGEPIADWSLEENGELHLSGEGVAGGAGLYAEGDAYVLRLPLLRAGAGALTRLSLPRGVVLDDVVPAPTRAYWRSGRLALIFDAGRVTAAFVRLRCNGGLGTEPPTAAAIQASLVGEMHRLAAASPTARWSVPGWAGAQRVTVDPTLATVTVGEAMELAGEVTVEFTADLAASGGAVRAWPLRARWRAGSAPSFEPATQADAGTLDAGRYRHADLGVSLDAHGRVDRVLRRVDSHLAEAQVQVWRVGPRGDLDRRVGALLLATRVRPGEDEASVAARLSGGATLSGGARPTTGEEGDFVGSGAAAARAVAREWEIDEGDGRPVRRERWLSVATGDRRILLRLFAVGSTRRAAQDALRVAHVWLAGVVAAVTVE